MLQTISVLIPTWRRPDELAVCLDGLRRQTVAADQIVVTVRSDDELTRGRLVALRASGLLPVGCEVVTVGPVPLTAAMNAGLALTTGDLVALTDDDAEPRADWLERCAEALAADEALGGVGGRDWQPYERWDEQVVGVVSSYGRTVGNHHLGAGAARDVDLLKGVNACFRGDVLRRTGFDRRLRGRGNVTHWELSLCLAMRQAGWRLLYDPAIAVEHRPAFRHDGDVNARGGFDAATFVDSVHNVTLSVLEYLPTWGRVAFITWAAGIGTGTEPGLAQIGRLIARGRTKHLGQRWLATVRGRMMGVRTFLAGPGHGAGIRPPVARVAVTTGGRE